MGTCEWLVLAWCESLYVCFCPVCEQCSWEPTQRMLGWLQERFGGTLSPHMAEYCFDVQKNSKIAKGKHKCRRSEKSWGVAIARNVVNSVHHYEAVPIDGVWQPEVAGSSLMYFASLLQMHLLMLRVLPALVHSHHGVLQMQRTSAEVQQT